MRASLSRASARRPFAPSKRAELRIAALLWIAACVPGVLGGCSLDLDALRVHADAAPRDAGTTDAEVTDAGDASALVDLGADASSDDAGSSDLGADAAMPDAGSCSSSCVPALMFGTPFTFSLDVVPVALATGDVDGDGLRDIVVLGATDVAKSVPAQVQTLGVSRASACDALDLRGAPVTVTSVASATALSVADVDGDGFDDVAVAGTAGTVALHRGSTTGVDAGALGTFTGLSFGVLAAEGLGHLVVATGGSTGSLVPFAVESSGPLSPGTLYSFTSPLGAIVAVVGPSGQAGFATPSLFDEQVQVYEFGSPPLPIIGGTPTFARAPGAANRLAAGHLNGDTASDLVTNVIGRPQVHLLRRGLVGWEEPVTVTVTGVVNGIALGQLAGDARDEVVLLVGAKLVVYPLGADLTNPTTALGPPRTLTLPGVGRYVTVDDLDSDGLNDIAVIGDDGAGGHQVRVFPGSCR